MIIDFHTHTFPEKIASGTIALLERNSGIKANTDGTIVGLLDSMERSGIDMSVILPVVTRPEQFQTVNNFAVQINEKYKGKLLSFGGIHPLSQNYKQELNYIQSLGLAGIKLHPDYQKTAFDDSSYKHIIDYASELGLVIVTHAGVDIGIPEPVCCPPEKAREVIRELKPPKLVLAHTGGWQQWNRVEELLVGEDVYLDCSFSSGYLSAVQFERIARKHGVEKILFATDSPWENPKQTINWIESTTLTNSEKEKIYSQNALDILPQDVLQSLTKQ